MWNLKEAIVGDSDAHNFMDALNEWYLSGELILVRSDGRCVCSKEGCRYLYEITNKINGKVIRWLGSQCIKKIGGTIDRDRKILTTADCKIRKGKLKGKTFRQVYHNHLPGEVSQKYLLYEEVQNRMNNIQTKCSHCYGLAKLKDRLCRDCFGGIKCSHCQKWGCDQCSVYLDILKKFDNSIVDFGKYKGVPFHSFLRPDYRMESYSHWVLNTFPSHHPFCQYLRAKVYLKK